MDRRLSSSGIPSFRWVLRQKLAASAMPLSIDDIAKAGITVVVSLVPKKEILFKGGRSPQEKIQKLGIAFHNLPVKEKGAPSPKQFSTFLRIMRNAEENPNTRVLVHCHLGVGRTGTMIAAYLIAKQGHIIESAYREIRHGLSMVCLDAIRNNPQLLARIRKERIPIRDFISKSFHFPESQEQENFLKSIKPRAKARLLERAAKVRQMLLKKGKRKKPL